MSLKFSGFPAYVSLSILMTFPSKSDFSNMYRMKLLPINPQPPVTSKHFIFKATLPRGRAPQMLIYIHITIHNSLAMTNQICNPTKINTL
jgi:hypothetical protein